MFKHIIGQSIYQLAILMLLIFHGDNFIPEYPDTLDTYLIEKNLSPTIKYNNGNFLQSIQILKIKKKKGYVRSGRYVFIDNASVKDYEDLEDVFKQKHINISLSLFFLNRIMAHQDISP